MGETVPCETWLDRSEATRCSTGFGSDVGPGEKLCKDVDGFVFDKEPMRGDKVEEVLEKSRRRIGVIFHNINRATLVIYVCILTQDDLENEL